MNFLKMFIIKTTFLYPNVFHYASLCTYQRHEFFSGNCSNALPFNLVHFPKGEYPGKLTQREIISEEELSEHLDCLSE